MSAFPTITTIPRLENLENINESPTPTSPPLIRTPRSMPVSPRKEEEDERIAQVARRARSTSSTSSSSIISPRKFFTRKCSLEPTEDIFIFQIEEIMKECPHKVTSCEELKRVVQEFCYKEENSRKSNGELIAEIQTTGLLIKKIIERVQWLVFTLQSKEKNIPLEEELITKLNSLIFFSLSNNGLKGFLLFWDNPHTRMIKMIFNLCVHSDNDTGMSILGYLKSWGHEKAIDNLEAIRQLIGAQKEYQQLAIHRICQKKYEWVSKKEDPYPLLNIKWEQVVRSLFQKAPLINQLLLGPEKKTVDFPLVEGSAIACQRHLMSHFFGMLSDELDKVKREQDVLTTSTTASLPGEIKDRASFLSFCSGEDYDDIKDKIRSLGALAYLIPMMLSVSCWSKADAALREEIFPLLFPSPTRLAQGYIGFMVVSDPEHFPDGEIEILNEIDVIVRQQRHFKIVYREHQPVIELPLRSPRDFPVVAHITFQFTLYPSLENEWEGNIQVLDLKINLQEHANGLIQLLEDAIE